MVILAAELKRIRLALNESQEVFGERFAVHQSTIARWESDGPKSSWSRKTVKDFVDLHARRRPRRAAGESKAA
jgi:transcriptional regulator with XRE-family HTH domain